MVRLLKKFIDHQIALLHNEAVNPPIIAWIATVLFVPSIPFSYYIGKYLNLNVVPYLPIPIFFKAALFLLIYIFSPLLFPLFIVNNARC